MLAANQLFPSFPFYSPFAQFHSIPPILGFFPANGAARSAGRRGINLPWGKEAMKRPEEMEKRMKWEMILDRQKREKLAHKCEREKRE
jgi:hypothetical protein